MYIPELLTVNSCWNDVNILSVGTLVRGVCTTASCGTLVMYHSLSF